MEILDPFLKQVVQWAILAGPFAILILAFLWGKETRDHKNTKVLCAAKIDLMEKKGDGLQAALDAQRDARLADAMKMLPILESNNSVNLSLSAAMENRNRAQDGMALILQELNINVEHLQDEVKRMEGKHGAT